jgi:hypothetical protein
VVNTLSDPVEIYVLSCKRSSEIASRFLDELAPERYPVAIDFPFPEFSDKPEIIFGKPEDLIRHLEVEVGESYSIYWNVRRGIAALVMVFFLKDGGMIVGLGGPMVPAEQGFSSMQRTVQGRFGYITSGSCPPSTKEEFISICRGSTLLNLCDGRIGYHRAD